MELSKQLGQAPPVNIPRDGKYTVFKNAVGDGGFYDTPVGKELRNVAIKWNEIIYNNADPNFDQGFDFKLNVPTKPFAKAINVAKPELPKLSTAPATDNATTGVELVRGKGSNKYLSVQVAAPTDLIPQLPPGTKGRFEYHVTIVSPPEMMLLSDSAAAQISGGVELAGAPRLNGGVQRRPMAYTAAIEWSHANAFRHQLELKSKAEVEAIIQAHPALAKSVDLSGDVPRLTDSDLHVTLSGGVNEAAEQKSKSPPNANKEPQ
jgi:hypothetical protein